MFYKAKQIQTGNAHTVTTLIIQQQVVLENGPRKSKRNKFEKYFMMFTLCCTIVGRTVIDGMTLKNPGITPRAHLMYR